MESKIFSPQSLCVLRRTRVWMGIYFFRLVHNIFEYYLIKSLFQSLCTSVYEYFLVKKKQPVDALQMLRKEFELKLKQGRKNYQIEKKRYAEEAVLKALHKQRVSLEEKFNKILDEKSKFLPVEEEKDLIKPPPIDREESLRRKASVFAGQDQKPCCKSTRCSICLVNKVCVLYEPCMHVATCIDCAPRHIILGGKSCCQMCNKPINQFRIVYF